MPDHNKEIEALLAEAVSIMRNTPYAARLKLYPRLVESLRDCLNHLPQERTKYCGCYLCTANGVLLDAEELERNDLQSATLPLHQN